MEQTWNIGSYMIGPTETKGLADKLADKPVDKSADKSAITSTRQKDPKRVDAGKRLGQTSKQIREQKMREKIESEQGWGYGYLVGLAGLGLAALSVYYARAQHKRETQVKPDGSSNPSDSDKSEGVKITKDPTNSDLIPSATSRKLVTLDTLDNLDDLR